jgi:hypothetical protein
MVGVAPFIAAFRPFTTRTTVTAITVTTAAAITTRATTTITTAITTGAAITARTISAFARFAWRTGVFQFSAGFLIDDAHRQANLAALDRFREP